MNYILRVLQYFFMAYFHTKLSSLHLNSIWKCLISHLGFFIFPIQLMSLIILKNSLLDVPFLLDLPSLHSNNWLKLFFEYLNFNSNFCYSYSYIYENLISLRIVDKFLKCCVKHYRLDYLKVYTCFNQLIWLSEFGTSTEWNEFYLKYPTFTKI